MHFWTNGVYYHCQKYFSYFMPLNCCNGKGYGCNWIKFIMNTIPLICQELCRQKLCVFMQMSDELGNTVWNHVLGVKKLFRYSGKNQKLWNSTFIVVLHLTIVMKFWIKDDNGRSRMRIGGFEAPSFYWRIIKMTWKN